MSPLEQKVTQLEEQVKRLQAVTDVSFVEQLKRRLSTGPAVIETGGATTGTSATVRNATDDGSATVAADYTGVAILTINGTVIGRIGYY